MDKIFEYSISYPIIRHPLANEKEQVKLKYASLLKLYSAKFFESHAVIAMRTERFINDFLNGKQLNSAAQSDAASDILKTRFTPFRFFSYRYIFLFDCVFLFTPTNKGKAQKICDELKATVNQRYHKQLDEIIRMMFEDDSKLIKSAAITAEQFEAWERLRRFAETKEKGIVFTATMSAGKSTLINALIGQDVSNAKKAACTSKILHFYSSAMPHTVFNLVSERNEIVNIPSEKVRNILTTDNNNYAVIGYFFSKLSEAKYCLIDTPGVDSFLNPDHKLITRNILGAKEHDVIVYVIPVESYGSESDYYHLKYILEKVKFKQIVFVINMIDTCNFEDDSIAEIIDDVRSHLEDIGYKMPLICPMSAKAGFLLKQSITGQRLGPACKELARTFCDMFYEDEFDLSCYYKDVLGNIIEFFPPRKINYSFDIPIEKLQKAYEHTGLPQFEKIIKKIMED